MPILPKIGWILLLPILGGRGLSNGSLSMARSIPPKATRISDRHRNRSPIMCLMVYWIMDFRIIFYFSITTEIRGGGIASIRGTGDNPSP